MKGGFVSLNLFTHDIEPYVVILIMMSDCFDIYIDYDIKNVHVHGQNEGDAKKAYECCPFKVNVEMGMKVAYCRFLNQITEYFHGLGQAGQALESVRTATKARGVLEEHLKRLAEM